MEHLLRDIKNYLDITYEDDQTDQKLEGLALRGQKYLDDVAGKPLDYESEGTPKALLLDYCRYARNNALELFGTNFGPDLIALRIGTQVEEYAEESDGF